MSKWSKTHLGECCEIIAGATPDTSIDAYWNGDIPWATPKDLSELDGAYISNTPRKLTREGLNSCAASILPPWSVLFSSRAPIGHVALNTVPMATNQGFKSFVPDPQRVDAKFLYHWLRKNRSYLESLGNGATFKEVSKAIVSRIEIHLPPLTEQRRIAELLDRAEAMRTKRRAALAQLDALNKGIFLDLFGDPSTNSHRWPTRALAELIRSDDTINYGVIQPGNALAAGVPLVRVGNLIEGRVAPQALKKIDPTIEAKHKRSRLHGNEVLVVCVGHTIGTIALADESVRGFNIARAIARIPLSDAANPIFISAYLRTAHIQRHFTSELRTVGQPTLNIKQLSETPIILPPLGLQREFARRIEAVETLRTTQRSSLAEMDALFASLQHRAFRGEL